MSGRFQVEFILNGNSLGLIWMHNCPKEGETVLVVKNSTYAIVTEVTWLVASFPNAPFNRARVVLDAGPEEVNSGSVAGRAAEVVW